MKPRREHLWRHWPGGKTWGVDFTHPRRDEVVIGAESRLACERVRGGVEGEDAVDLLESGRWTVRVEE